MPVSHVVSDPGAGILGTSLHGLSHEVGEAGLPEILRLYSASLPPPLAWSPRRPVRSPRPPHAMGSTGRLRCCPARIGRWSSLSLPSPGTEPACMCARNQFLSHHTQKPKQDRQSLSLIYNRFYCPCSDLSRRPYFSKTTHFPPSRFNQKIQ